MGFFSKIAKGIKGAVKKVARTVKQVAKRAITALPGGKKLWKFGTKVGQGVMKGLGKLGPIGIIALSFVLPAIGGAIWASMGPAAVTMAANGSLMAQAFVGAAEGIFAASNFIGGTLGAMGTAISEGASGILAGEFGAAASTFATNMGAAFSGTAGSAAVSAAGTLTAGVATAAAETAAIQAASTGIDASFAGAPSSSSSAFSTAAEKATADKIAAQAAAPSLLDKVQSGVKQAKSVLDIANKFSGQGVPEAQGTQFAAPERIQPLQSVSTNVQGVGSSGFSLLSGVQGLKESVENSQNLLFT